MSGRYLVTGATGAVGGDVRQALIKAGHEVVCVVRSSLRAEEAGILGYIPLDLGGHDIFPGQVQAMITDASDLGGPFDGIFHAAAEEVVWPLGSRGADRQWERAMWTTDVAYGILCAAAMRGVAPGARIVLMSSVAAHRGVAGMVAYSAARGAIEAMVRSAAVELARKPVLVNAVAAGGFRSKMHDRITRAMTEQAQTAYALKHPLGIGSAQQVADVVLSLLLPTNTWQTGTVVVADGGFLAA